MKKLYYYLLFLTISINTFAQENKKVNYSAIYDFNELLEIGKKITEPIEKYEFYKHLYLVQEVEYIKTNSLELNLDNLKKLTDVQLYDFIKKHASEYTSVNDKPLTLKQLDKKEEYEEFTLREKIEKTDKSLIEKDSMFYQNYYTLINPSGGMCNNHIESENKTIIIVEGDCGTGASVHFTYFMLKDNKIIELGDGYNKLKKSEYKKLEKIVKNKEKDFSNFADRSGAEFSQRPNGNFIVTLRGYINDDTGASGGSLEITYETIDLMTIIPNSVLVEKYEYE